MIRECREPSRIFSIGYNRKGRKRQSGNFKNSYKSCKLPLRSVLVSSIFSFNFLLHLSFFHLSIYIYIYIYISINKYKDFYYLVF